MEERVEQLERTVEWLQEELQSALDRLYRLETAHNVHFHPVNHHATLALPVEDKVNV